MTNWNDDQHISVYDLYDYIAGLEHKAQGYVVCMLMMTGLNVIGIMLLMLNAGVIR